MYSDFQIEFALAILVLVLWSKFMWFWLYRTRLPAIKNAKMKLNRYRPRGEQMNELPSEARWIADNYNHLNEQPTHFYALCFVILVLNLASSLNLFLVWAYVLTRIIHSIYQAKVNIIPIRFLLFSLSSLWFLIMLVYNIIRVIGLLNN